jgi:hypothetical protein
VSGTAAPAIQGYWDALARNDLQGAATFLDPGFTEDWPQSGERIVGVENWLAMVTRHPTFPAVTVLSHEGRDDLWVSRAHYDYPGDEGPVPYEVCAIQWLRDGRIARAVEYFAAPFEAAEWRADIVERIR